MKYAIRICGMNMTFSGGVRGKYVDRFPKGANVVVLDPDVAQIFTDSDSVNEALRALASIIQKQSGKAQRSWSSQRTFKNAPWGGSV